MPATELRSGPVRLRPLEQGDLELLVAGRDAGVGPRFRGDEQAARRVQQRKIERGGRFADGRLDLAIEVDGRFAGTVEARQPAGALPPGVYEIGVSLFDDADRRRGLGTIAVRLLTDHLFADARTHRVQASTWVENDGMRRVLEKLGFTLEGVMHAFMPATGGERHDYALYAVTRSDWERSPRDER